MLEPYTIILLIVIFSRPIMYTINSLTENIIIHYETIPGVFHVD